MTETSHANTERDRATKASATQDMTPAQCRAKALEILGEVREMGSSSQVQRVREGQALRTAEAQAYATLSVGPLPDPQAAETEAERENAALREQIRAYQAAFETIDEALYQVLAHSAALATTAQDPRCPSFGDDWTDFCTSVSSALSDDVLHPEAARAHDQRVADKALHDAGDAWDALQTVENEHYSRRDAGLWLHNLADHTAEEAQAEEASGAGS